jgi:hypothetical protein
VHRDRYLEEWAHAEKLAAISRRAELVLADGLEGRRAKMSKLMALYVKFYDAGAAREGTRDRYQRMVSRRTNITAPGQRCLWTAPRH